MIVMKFGGTSTQDATAMTNVAEIVKSHVQRQPFVVISAIAQATNVLENAGKLAAEGRPSEARDLLLELIERHYDIVDHLITDKQRSLTLRKIISTYLAELEELVRGVAILRELTPRTLDSLYCYGELLSSRIVADVLCEHGLNAVWIDTKDFMITDENFNRALPMMDVVENRLGQIATPHLREGKVPVTQGFIGVTASGRRTTMGRESSDYSAAIIGAALSAGDVQIWTDVDGILTADPRVVETPRKVKRLTFEEAYELSYFGAKVLHPNTMLPAIEKNIPIHIYNSRRPQSSGTLVSATHDHRSTIIKSVAYKNNFVVLTVVPRKRLSQYIFWQNIFNILTRYNAVPALTATSEYNISIALDAKYDIQSMVHDLGEVGEVNVHDGKGIVCVVGANVRGSPAVVDKIFRSITDVAVTMISFGASTSNLSFVIDDEMVPEVVRRIHKEFFESAVNEEIFELLEHPPVPA